MSDLQVFEIPSPHWIPMIQNRQKWCRQDSVISQPAGRVFLTHLHEQDAETFKLFRRGNLGSRDPLIYSENKPEVLLYKVLVRLGAPPALNSDVGLFCSVRTAQPPQSRHPGRPSLAPAACSQAWCWRVRVATQPWASCCICTFVIVGSECPVPAG